MAIATKQQKNEKIARTLLTFAWVIEACAVITGLVISMMVATDTYNKNKVIDDLGASTNIANVIIAALPFVMVSIVELAKIPTAQAVYVTKNIIWKTLFILALCFLALITFETALNGFERNYRNLNYQVSQKSTVLEQLQERVQVLVDQNTRDSQRTREMVLSDFERQLSEISKKRDVSLESLKDQQSLVSVKSNNVQLTALKEELQGLIRDKETIIASRDKEVAETQSRLASKAETALQESKAKQLVLKQQLQEERDRLQQLQDEKRSAVAKANIFTRTSTENKYNKQIESQQKRVDSAQLKLNSYSVVDYSNSKSDGSSERIQKIYSNYDSKIAFADEKISNKNKEIAKLSGLTQKDITDEQTRINNERNLILQTYESDRSVIEERKEKELLDVQSKEGRIQVNETEMRALDDEIAGVKSEINELAKDNQIFRIAKMFSPNAKTIADVEMSMVDLVSKIWFGSLAMVIAVTGIILALASQVVRDERNTDASNKNSRSGLVGALRSVSLAMNRRTRRQPKEIVKVEVKEVVKEVPVDKVVFKEVAKEVVRKELVHVPFYTADPKLINKTPEDKNEQ